MEFKDLKNKSAKELETLLAEERETLRKHIFQAMEQQLKKVHLIKASRRLIAQMLTLLRAK